MSGRLKYLVDCKTRKISEGVASASEASKARPANGEVNNGKRLVPPAILE